MGAAGLIYTALFMVTPCSALRLGRIGWMALAILVMRGGLLMLGHPVELPLDATMTVLIATAAGGLRLGARVCLVRDTRAHMSEELRTGCRGLFVPYEERRPGCFLLRARTRTQTMTITELADGVQLVVLPAAAGEAKLRLLVNWWSKQHPGPLPRLRIDLTRRRA